MVLIFQVIAQQCVIGYPGKSKRGLASRIVNGPEIVPNSIPWQVYIESRYEALNSVFNCGGTIISPYHILTAAHCLYDKTGSMEVRPKNVKVHVGQHHLFRFDGKETIMDVKCFAVHPSYDQK